jgi:hypothetical protein
MRNPGCPLKTLLDSYIETRAGHKAQVPESIMMMMMRRRSSNLVILVLRFCS